MCNDEYDFTMVLGDGMDIDMGMICGCTDKPMSWCEDNCIEYDTCCNISLANDILVLYEEVKPAGMIMPD